MMRTMFEILTEQYPNVDWNTLEVLPIMYLARTDEYRVIEALWPIDLYPTMPTSDELKGWLE
jgi:hypothetical protein